MLAFPAWDAQRKVKVIVTMDTKSAIHMPWVCQKATGACLRWETSSYFLQGSRQRKGEEVHRALITHLNQYLEYSSYGRLSIHSEKNSI